MLTIYRRHVKGCAHQHDGRKYRRCRCPIWVDGFLNGVELRESLGMRDWEKAQQTYQKVMQLQPENPVAANNLAYLMLEHDLNADIALSLAQTGRRGLPNSPRAADTLGWAYYHKGTYHSAVDLLQEAEKQSPKDANICYHLGLSYEKLGDKVRAKAEFERALQISPNPRAAEIRLLLAELKRPG